MDVWSTDEDSKSLIREEPPTMAEIIDELRHNTGGNEGIIHSENDEINDRPETIKDDLHGNVPRVVYKRRWYILFVFSLICVVQGEISNTWGPIADSAKWIYGWSDHDIALVTNLVVIASLLSIPFGTWLLDVKGLRKGCLFATLVLTLGTAVRCITTSSPASTWLVCSSQILIGLSGPVVTTAAPLLAITWFPLKQRTVSVATIVIMINVGISLSFVVGPHLVPDLSTCQQDFGHCSHPHMKSNLLIYLYASLGTSGLLLLLILIYFPPEPPTPPSVSASLPRANYIEGLVSIAKNINFWILALAYSLPSGVGSGWIVVLAVNLSRIEISQDTSGWIGFAASVVASFGAIGLGFLADNLKGRLKMFLTILYSVGALSFIVFLYLYYGVFSSVPVLYVSLSIAALGVMSTAPLFFIMASEITFPTGEAISNGAFVCLSQIFSIIFLGVLSIPDLDTSWINWCYIGSLVVSIPLLLLFKEEYHRLHLDNISN